MGSIMYLILKKKRASVLALRTILDQRPSLRSHTASLAFDERPTPGLCANSAKNSQRFNRYEIRQRI